MPTSLSRVHLVAWPSILALMLTLQFTGCALPSGSEIGPNLVRETPLGNGEELLVRVFQMPLVAPHDWPEYEYWVCEKRSPSRRALLTRGYYQSMAIHASDDLRFLVVGCTIMAGNTEVGVWRQARGPVYRHLDAGLDQDSVFAFYLREWKAQHSRPEDKDLHTPEPGMHVRVSFVRWTKPNREILVSLNSHDAGPNPDNVDNWYFLCDLETLRLSRDLTGVELPSDR